MSLPDLHIGPVHVSPGLVLAPMSGVTDSPFRRLVKRCSGDAVGLVMSEFIQIEALTRGALRSVIRMSFHPEERPVAIQIYGADPGMMAEAAKMAEDAGADVVDINCGCPAPKIVRRGGGAGLLRELPVLAEILDATVAAVSIPVTIKIRNGWCEDSLNYMETLRLAEDHGASAIAVHGRTRLQLYRGSADWDVVRKMKLAASIPVLGSGDVLTARDALDRFAATGCDGILIGRGAITNPWIFRQIQDEVDGRAPFAPTWADTVDAIESYLGWLADMYPEKVLPGRLKMMMSRLLKGFDGAADVRATALRMDDPRAMLAYIEAACRGLGIWDTPRDFGAGGGATVETEAEAGSGSEAVAA
ncbi:MAG: tRNA dihydrouridine synthase DusB [Deltaproteobacteria bacterium]|nr:tRNA dihydrouridine synthase DusB [Deltaproteobacteria bacterium]